MNMLKLDNELKARLSNVAVTHANVAHVRECLSELEAQVLLLGPHWRVKPFGGLANGFGIQGSDVDATCYVEGMEESFAPQAIQELQLQLLPMLLQHPRFEVMKQIWNARVPILKLRFDRTLDVDLSCHNTEALPNTHLLRAYAKLDPQVRNLGILVKRWAKGEGICGAPQGYLSSYALTLMAIYFLQVDPVVKMPCLPTWAFTGRGPTPLVARVSWSCVLPTAALLGRFFRFYAVEFQWYAEVVSIRRGCRALATAPEYEQLRAGLTQRLHIEDPFLTGRNLHCVLGLDQECVFYAHIWQAFQAMQNCSLPVGLRSFGLADSSLASTVPPEHGPQSSETSAPLSKDDGSTRSGSRLQGDSSNAACSSDSGGEQPKLSVEAKTDTAGQEAVEAKSNPGIVPGAALDEAEVEQLRVAIPPAEEVPMTALDNLWSRLAGEQGAFILV